MVTPPHLLIYMTKPPTVRDKEKSLVDQAVDAIIRPPRRHYDVSKLPLYMDCGDNQNYIRHPLNFSNARDQKIVGSIYVMEGQDLMNGGPCIIYMHGNASSQMEGQFLIPNFCPRGFAVYCFDFAGCGESDGDFISLGYYETQDVNYLMDFLHSTFHLGPFALWGRSMGAATAVLARYPKLKCIVVDSTYTSVNDVVGAIAKKQKLPGFLVPAVLWFLKNTVKGKAGFNMADVSPLEVGSQPDAVPMIQGHATDDEFIPIEQGRTLFSAYSNTDKVFLHLTGGHNGRRKTEWLTEAIKFVLSHFGYGVSDVKYVAFSGLNSQDDEHFKDFNAMINQNRHS